MNCRLLFVLALSIGTAACNPQAATRSGAPPANPSKEQGVEPILVGATVSLSGRFSREGASRRAGYLTWVEVANAAGGVDVAGVRRPVRLVIYDDESETSTAVRMVDRLIKSDGVTLLLGPYSSQITTATATLAEQFGALTVAPDASWGSVYARGLEMVVSILPTDDRYFDGLLDLVTTVWPRPRSSAFLVPDEPFLTAAADGARDRAGALGLESVIVERYKPDARDVTGALERVARARPDLLVAGAEQERLRAFLPEIDELRLAPSLLALVPGPLPPDLSAISRRGNGLLTLDWWTSGLTAAGPVLGSAREFAFTFERIHGYQPDARAAAAAAAGLALQLGVQRANSVEPRRVRAVLSDLEVVTFWGRLGWDAAGRNRAATVPVMQLQHGVPVVVHPRELAEARLRYAPSPAPDRVPS